MTKHLLSRFILICSLCMAMTAARAQSYVNIGDSTFGNWLFVNGYSSCMIGDPINGWQLDITCQAVLAATAIDMSNQPITDLHGIENFVNLKSLYAGGMQLRLGFYPPQSLEYLDVSFQQYGNGFAGMSTLPPGLKYFDCSNNVVTDLPPLPSTLVTLKCYGNAINPIASLPDSLEYFDISQGYPGATLPALPNKLSYLDCHENGMPNFTGSLPPHLTYLDCSYNYMDTLPALQNTTLQTLICSNNSFMIVPALPASLTYLDCSTNDLDSLPALNSSLQNLNCSSNYITALPALPASLQILVCSSNQLTALPALDPALSDLECDWNFITTLPTLPPSLDTLICWHNFLTGLPALPNHLIDLTCGDSAFVNPPVLPASLKQFNLSYSPYITALPALPQGLYQVYFDYLNVTSIPTLPDSLKGFSCVADSNLTCLPLLPQSLLSMYFGSGTPITCMPNRLPAVYAVSPVNPNLLPLCNPMSGCIFDYNIWGNVHLDSTFGGTCTDDSLHNSTQLTGVKLLLMSNGSILQQTYTNQGQYSFKTNGIGNYQVVVDTTADNALKVVCPGTFGRPQAITAADSLFSHQDFGLECNGEDEAVIGIGGRFSPGRINNLVISAGEMSAMRYNIICGYHPSGTITVVIAGPAHYTGGSVPTSVHGDTLTFAVADFDNLNEIALVLAMMTDTTATLGAQVCVSASVSVNANDINPANNFLSQCFTVVSSLDPNEKEVYPTTIAQPGDWQTYTINFQNTGTDTAYNIIIRDTLSSWIDANSFQYLASSAPRTLINLIGNAIEFDFPDIMLVDSATSNTASRGWVQYKVRTKSNLPMLTPVKNTAYIYFDFNSAVVTNTVTNTYDTSSITTTCSDTTITLSHTMCQGDSFAFGGRQLTVAATYRDTLARVHGCDSIFVLTLTVKPIARDTISHSICSGDSFTFGGQNYHSAGYYSQTLSGSNSCDSVVTLHLKLNPAPVVNLNWQILLQRHDLSSWVFKTPHG